MSVTASAVRLVPVLERISSLPQALDDWWDGRSRLYWVASSLALFLVALAVVVPAAIGRGGVSPVDELWYTDAVDKAYHGVLTRTGAHIDDYTRQVMACRGVIGLHGPAATCGGPQPDASLPLGGLTSADIHAPTYFFLTAAVAHVVIAVNVTDDVLIAGRLAGVLWLSLGLLLSVVVFRAWGGGRTVPVLLAAAIGMSPLLVSVSGYLTPDALALAVGAGVLLVVTRWLEGRAPSWALFVAALSTSFVKVPFLLAPVFAALLIVLRQWTGPAMASTRARGGALLLLSGAAAGAVAWQILRGVLAMGPAAVHPGGSPPVSLATFGRYFGYYLDNIPNNSGAPIPVPELLGLSVRPLVWLLVAAALGGVMLLPRGHQLLAVCWSGLAGMVLGSVVLSSVVLVATHAFLVGTPRYGLALLPLWATPLAVSRRVVTVMALVLVVVGSAAAHWVGA